MAKILKNNFATPRPAYMWAAFATLVGKIGAHFGAAFVMANTDMFANGRGETRLGSLDNSIIYSVKKDSVKVALRDFYRDHYFNTINKATAFHGKCLRQYILKT